MPIPTAEEWLKEVGHESASWGYDCIEPEHIEARDRAVRRKAWVDAVQVVRGMTTAAVARKVGVAHISMPPHHDDTLECAASCIEETLIAKLDAEAKDG